MNNPKVSVIIAFRNGEKFLQEAVESILNQTLTDFELILIDDASIDNTDIIIGKYKYNSRVKYIKNSERKGKSYNLNYGISISNSKYIAIMDGDDISNPARLAKQYAFLEDNADIAVVGCFFEIIDERGIVVDKRTKPLDPIQIKNNILIYSPVLQPCVMFKADVVRKIGGYREEFEYGQDIDLWYRVIFSGYKISNIPEYLFKYRYHSDNTTHNSKKIAKEDLRIKLDAISTFHLKIGIKKWFFIFGQFLVEYIATGRQRQHIEGFIKKIILGTK